MISQDKESEETHMFARILSASLFGIEGRIVQVEVDVIDGFPGLNMVGFLSSEVKEAKDRVRSALRNSNYKLPAKHYTINLTPANVKKSGSYFDVAIGVALLTGLKLLKHTEVENILFVGELSLSGRLSPVNGILSIVESAKKANIKTMIIPDENKKEASYIKGIQIYSFQMFSQVIDFLKNPHNYEAISPVDEIEFTQRAIEPNKESNWEKICGQYPMKRATQIAVAGHHNLLYIGPPGSGKTLMAKSIQEILPALSLKEAILITKIYSAYGLISHKDPVIKKRPFRKPHHTISAKSLVGNFKSYTVNELMLANGGVLFLDELSEFNKNTLESLRQPLEQNKMQFLSQNQQYDCPLSIQLIAAMNPCPCGFYPDRNRCNCSIVDIQNHLKSLSQPLLDRIDLCVSATPITFLQIKGEDEVEDVITVQKRIENAVLMQKERYINEPISYNAQLSEKQIRQYCVIDKKSEDMMRGAFDYMNLSGRSYHKIIKVARTIADLDGDVLIQEKHIAEAIYYKSFDKKLFAQEKI